MRDMKMLKGILMVSVIGAMLLFLSSDISKELQYLQYAFLITAVIAFFIIILKGREFEENRRLAKLVIGFDILLIPIIIATIYLKEKNLVDIYQEYYLGFSIQTIVMGFFGYIAKDIPFNRYIGLRLPWTVMEENTWNYAHQILWKITLPIIITFSIMFVGAHMIFHNSYYMYLIAIFMGLTYILIPGILSLIYFNRLFKKPR